MSMSTPDTHSVTDTEDSMFKRIDAEQVSDTDVKFTDEVGSKMKEIVFDAEKHIVATKDFTMRDVLDALMDKQKVDALEELNKLVSEKKISDFRVSPIGVVVTQDYRPSRISITVDATGKVVDAQQG